MMCIICNIVIYVIKDTIYFSNYVNVIGMLQCMRVCATCIKVLVNTPSLFAILLPFFKDRSGIRTIITSMSTHTVLIYETVQHQSFSSHLFTYITTLL